MHRIPTTYSALDCRRKRRRKLLHCFIKYLHLQDGFSGFEVGGFKILSRQFLKVIIGATKCIVILRGSVVTVGLEAVTTNSIDIVACKGDRKGRDTEVLDPRMEARGKGPPALVLMSESARDGPDIRTEHGPRR